MIIAVHGAIVSAVADVDGFPEQLRQGMRAYRRVMLDEERFSSCRSGAP